MSDYTKVYDGAAKDAAESTITGADFDAEFSSIATAIGTKTNKAIPATAGNLAGLDVNGDLQDTGMEVSGNSITANLVGNASTATTASTITGQGTLATLNSVATANIDNLAVTGAKMASATITQSKMAASSIGQGQMKTTQGTVSVSLPLNSFGLTPVLPGGSYGFMPLVYSDHASDVDFRNFYKTSASTSQQPPGAYFFNKSLSVVRNGYAKVRYVQASPPYDLGDGEIKLFIFVEVDNTTGDIIRTYAAPEAPWHYSGPTDIRAEFYDDQGRGFRSVRDTSGLPFTREQARLDPAKLELYMSELSRAPRIFEEITQEIKNADMALIPAPMVATPDSTVVLLDPVSPLLEGLAALSEQDEDTSVCEMIHKGDIIVTNTSVNRAGPPGINVVRFRLR